MVGDDLCAAYHLHPWVPRDQVFPCCGIGWRMWADTEVRPYDGKYGLDLS